MKVIGIFFLLRLKALPLKPQKKTFEKEIKNISPRFIEIYNQSEMTGCLGLNEVAGCGFRKSLEILIKDYCIVHLSHNEKIIKNENLSDCINRYIDSKNIKECAKRAAWK